MTFGSLSVIMLWLLSDPDLGLINNLPFGGSLLATLIIPTKAVLYVTLLHISRKAMCDYIDLEKVYVKALETPQGAGSVAIAVSLLLIAVAFVIYAATVS
jgi:hypothetical protein